MRNSVELNAEQQALRTTIEKKVTELRKYFEMDRNDRNYNDIANLQKEMAEAAHSLHMQLKPYPKHHRYMIENRGCKPEDPEFYNHIHPVEDLLKYLDDTSANDDPIDRTLGEKFYLEIYTRRWGHYDRYHLVRNKKGWAVSHLSYNEQGGRDAEPILSYILTHDSVSYPRNVSSIMEDIWYRAQDEGLSREEVQSYLNEVAEWISLTEKNYPSHIAR